MVDPVSFVLILSMAVPTSDVNTERDERFPANLKERYSLRSTLEARSDAFDAAPLILRRVLPDCRLRRFR